MVPYIQFILSVATVPHPFSKQGSGRESRLPTKTAVQKRLGRNIKQFGVVMTHGKYTEKQIEKVCALLITGLSDQQWQSIKSKYVLSRGARYEINAIIEAYWNARRDTFIAPTLKAKIKTTQEYLNRLQSHLDGLLTDRDLFRGDFPYYDLSPAEQRKVLERSRASLFELNTFLLKASGRTVRPNHRPSHNSLWNFITLLDLCLNRFGNKRLTERSANFAYDVVFLADPKATPRQIGTVLKEYVGQRDRWAKTDLQWMSR
jgi:hypothetical protein